MDCMDEKRAIHKKTVAFKSHAVMRDTIALCDYSSEEAANCWYSSHEYEQIARECKIQIVKLEKGKKLDCRKYCERGLECRTSQGSAINLKNKRDAVDIVLLAQMNSCDEHEIALHYREASSGCQVFANLKGLRDQTAAKQAWADGTVSEKPTSRQSMRWLTLLK